MGKATQLLKELSGRIGPLTFMQTKSGKTAVYVTPEPKEEPTRSQGQMMIRLAWIILAALYVQFQKTLRRSHEGLKPGLSDYNAFLSDNTRMCRVYMTKTEVQNGGSILFPCQISRGKLPSIDYRKNGAGVLVTDIELGTLAIDDATTIADFSVAVLTMNDDYEEGDQLSFFYGVQGMDASTGTPRAKIKGYKVKLDTTDETPLWNVVAQLGFTTVDGCLGMSQTIVDGAAAWVHSREDEEGGLRVSTQSLFVDSSVLAGYTGDAAFATSVESYGGLNSSKKVFLRPDAETNLVGGAATTVPSGSGTNTNGTNGGSSTGSETGGNTGNTGGSSNGSGTSGSTGGGSETPTVSAPTISGNTPFEETTEVTISGPADATIHYTTDGSTPTSASTFYTEPLTLIDTTTVKAIAVKDGVSSTVVSRTFTKGSGEGGQLGGEE